MRKKFRQKQRETARQSEGEAETIREGDETVFRLLICSMGQVIALVEAELQKLEKLRLEMQGKAAGKVGVTCREL